MDEGRADRTCPRCGRTTAPRDGRALRFCGTCGQMLTGAGPSFTSFGATPPAATASLLLGLFSLMPFVGVVFALLAIPLGLTAASQIEASGGRYSGKGMALTGVALAAAATLLWVSLCCGGWYPA